MAYRPVPSALGCSCGRTLKFTARNLIETDTGAYRGAIWQRKCVCGRSYTVEVADDPDYPTSD